MLLEIREIYYFIEISFGGRCFKMFYLVVREIDFN